MSPGYFYYHILSPQIHHISHNCGGVVASSTPSSERLTGALRSVGYSPFHELDCLCERIKCCEAAFQQASPTKCAAGGSIFSDLPPFGLQGCRNAVEHTHIDEKPEMCIV